MSETLRDLDTVDPVSLVGGKARSLQLLRSVGAPVPPAVILPTTVGAALGEGARLSDEAISSCRALGGPLIVRSSAVGEDGATAAFPGLLTSIFPVNPDDEAALREAVRAAAASWRAPRVLAYEAARGVRLEGVAVVIQRLVTPAFAGVLFTDGVKLRGEWCRGHGAALVDGAVTPGAFQLDRRAGTEPWRGAWVERETEDSGSFPLTADQRSQLVHYATALERRRGVALDLEWAVDGEGALWLVQARPITHHPTQLYSNANINENFPAAVTPLLVSFARAGYDAYFRNLARCFGLDPAAIAAHDQAFAGIIGVHGARLYYNLSNIHAVIRLMPFGDLLVDSFDVFVGAGQSAPTGARGGLGRLWQLGIVLAHVVGAYRDLPSRIRRFEATVNEVAETLHPRRLVTLSGPALAAGLELIRDVRLRRWLDASLADVAAGVTWKALGACLDTMTGEKNAADRHHALLEGLDVAGAWSMRALWELARTIGEEAAKNPECARTLHEGDLNRFRATLPEAVSAQLDDWLDRYGFRGSGELLLTEPSPQERPDQLMPLLSRYVTAIGRADAEGPARSLDKQRAAREQHTAALRAGLTGWRRAMGPVFGLLLRATQASVMLRERARFRQALLYARLRSVALALGERLVRADRLGSREDVFFLSIDELVDLGAGRGFSGDARELVALRRREHAALATLDLPDSFTLPVGHFVQPEGAITEIAATEPGSATTSAHTLSGVAASGGAVTGRAAVLLGLAEADRLLPGDILVAQQTDPGWAPLFFLVKGLVLERGGMLSHGSILARELGIPSVVGVAGATARIPHGATLDVDGDRGHVRVQ